MINIQKIKKINKFIVFFLITVFLLFLFFETSLRLFYPFYSNFNTEMWRYSTKIKTLSDVSGVSHGHMPDKESILYGVNIKTNSIGFRDYEYDLEKPADIKRIIVLGDSITLGWGVDLSQSYPKILEKMLNEESSVKNKKYEILNSAVGNYNTEMEVNIIKEYLYLDPDAVIVGFFPNDAEKTMMIKPGIIYQLKKRLYFYPFFWDRVMRLRYLFANKENKYDSKIHNFYLDEYKGKERIDLAFSELKSLSQSQNFSVYILIIPVFYNEFDDYNLLYVHQFVKGLCIKYNFECIDTFNNFKNYALKDIIISYEDAHPNVVGHKIIAESIYGLIKNE